MQRPDETDVVIIGGGLVGCATAYYLAQAGVECLVVERGEINREGSGTNAGSIHIQLRAEEIRYGDEVLRDFIPMKIEAGRLWAQIEQELGCDLGVKLKGGFLIAETEEEVNLARRIVAYERRHGLHAEFLSTSEMRSIAPNLSDGIRAAAYDPAEGCANTLLAGPAYARLAQRLGARFRTYTDVTATEPLDGGGFRVQTNTGELRAKRVINATGPWARKVARQVGVDIPAGGKVIQVNVTERREPILGQLVGHLSGGLTLKQTLNGTFMIGGGWPAGTDPDTGKVGLERASLVNNLGMAVRALPILGEVSLLRSWTGVIGHALDRDGRRLQVFGEVPGVPGYFMLAGGTLFTMGPLFARLMAEYLTTGKTSFPVWHHHPNRFDVKRVAAVVPTPALAPA